MDRYGSAGTSAQLGASGSPARGHRSGLVVNVDHHTAQAALFACTEGQPRFVSGAAVPSTATPPIDDVSVGARQALRAIEEHTGLHLVGPDGVIVPSSGDHGVDVFAITGQPVAPIRLSVITLGNSPLAAPLIAAARRTPTTIDILGDRARTSDGVFSGALLEQNIREFRPDAVVLLQGDTADTDWTAAVGTISSLANENVVTLIIIVAGDQLQQQAVQMTGDRADLRGIDPAEFSTPDIASALEAELHGLYDGRVDAHALVPAMERARFVSRVRAADLVTRFLARRRELAVVSVDAADGVLLHWATPDLSDVMVRPDIDAQRNVRSIFTGDLAGVQSWLPFTITNEEIAHWVLNRALRPLSIAEAPQDMAIERALLVELIRSAWSSMSASSTGELDLIIGGRPFSSMRSPALSVLALLDIFQPDPASGIVDIVLDTDGILPAAGAIGERSPAIAADIVEHDLLTPFAAALVVRGSGNDGEMAVRGQIRYASGETTRFSVPYGAIQRVKLVPSQAATVTIICEAGYTIGGQQQFPDLIIGGDDGNLRTGEMGVVIDARGRPLRSAGDPGSRSTRVSGWLEELGFRV